MNAPLSLEEALDIAAEIDNADDPVTLTEHGREVIEVLRDHVLAARKELDALPEMLRVGVGGARPAKAAKTDEELRAALAIVKAGGRYSGRSLYRKEGDAFIFERHATQAEDDAYMTVYHTGLAAGWGMMAERNAALAENDRLTRELSEAREALRVEHAARVGLLRFAHSMPFALSDVLNDAEAEAVDRCTDEASRHRTEGRPMNAPVVTAPALKPPSARQRDVLDFIVAYLRECGYPPTLREIGAALNVRSTNGITDHLRALERKGYLTHGAMLSRGLRLTAAAVAEYDAHEAPPAPCAPAAPIPSHQLVAWLVARALDAGVVPFSQMRAALGADDAEVRELTAQGRAIDDAMRATTATPTAEGTPT